MRYSHLVNRTDFQPEAGKDGTVACECKNCGTIYEIQYNGEREPNQRKIRREMLRDGHAECEAR